MHRIGIPNWLEVVAYTDLCMAWDFDCLSVLTVTYRRPQYQGWLLEPMDRHYQCTTAPKDPVVKHGFVDPREFVDTWQYSMTHKICPQNHVVAAERSPRIETQKRVPMELVKSLNYSSQFPRVVEANPREREVVPSLWCTSAWDPWNFWKSGEHNEDNTRRVIRGWYEICRKNRFSYTTITWIWETRPRVHLVSVSLLVNSKKNMLIKPVAMLSNFQILAGVGQWKPKKGTSRQGRQLQEISQKVAHKTVFETSASQVCVFPSRAINSRMQNWEENSEKDSVCKPRQGRLLNHISRK